MDLKDILFGDWKTSSQWLSGFRSLASTMPDWLDAAKRLVETAYAEDSRLRDAYSRIGCHLLEEGRAKEALQLFERDISLGRAGWFQRLRHAECLAACGDIHLAEEEIRIVYQSNPSAVNGFASIAWRLRDAGALTSPFEFAKRDIAASRLSPGYMLNVAELAAMESFEEAAEELVETAYSLDKSLLDGHTRLALVKARARGGDPEIKPMERDLKSGRLSSSRMVKLAHLHANRGDMEIAIRLVGEAYAKDKSLNDCHASLSNAIHMKPLSLPEKLELYRHDLANGRLSDMQRARMAINLESRLGLLAEAVESYSKAVAGGQGVQDGWSKIAINSIRFGKISIDDPATYGKMLELLRLQSKDPNETEAGRTAVHKAVAALAASGADASTTIARTHMAAASTGLDIPSQWDAISTAAKPEAPNEEPLPFLNARLACPRPSDLLVQFLEIAVEEAYFFKTDREAPFIIDAGANVGAAIAYFKWLLPKAEILAFEPNPKLHGICSGNIRLNGWTDVALKPVAISGDRGRVSFNCCEDMPMASSITSRPAKMKCDRVEVETCPLSDFITRPVDFLKLDIEGAESAAICALGDGLKLVERGFIEYHYSSSQEMEGNSLAKLIAALEGNSFSYKVSPQPSTHFHARSRREDRGQDSWSCSIFFEKR